MRRATAMTLILAAAALLTAGCSRKEKDLEITSGIAARVGDATITDREVELRLDRLNTQQKSEYAGKLGRARFLDMMIDEELIYEQAKKEQLHRDPEIRLQIALSEKAILLAEYYQRVIRPRIEVTDEEIEAYYRDNVEEFTTRTLMRAQHLFTKDRAKADEWVRRLRNGEDFAKIASQESEDETTSLVNGNLGYFNPGGYVKSIGYADRWSAAVEQLEAGDVSGVIPFEKGFSIVKVNEKTPARVQDLSEVRKQIIETLQDRKGRAQFYHALEELRKSTRIVNYAREEYVKTLRSARELWEAAQLENDTVRRIQFYRDIVNAYPQDPYAPQALFMIGFTYAEELSDHVNARKSLDELIRNYPDADVVESARWLIDNLQKPHPKFQSVDEMRDAMENGQEKE